MIRRRRQLGLATAMVFLALIAQLWRLQIASPDDFEQRAAGNRERLVHTPGPRGRIVDLQGRPLADTRPALAVVLDHAALAEVTEGERQAAFERLALELSRAGHRLDGDEIAARYEHAIGRRLQPIVLATDISAALWIALDERSLPGVAVEERTVRTYPHGPLAGHVIGHLGTVRDETEAAELSRLPEAAGKPYQPGDVVGRDGLEGAFEQYLRGTPEIRRVEIDADNRVVRTVEVVQAATPGADVHLTIDLDVQRGAEEAVAAQLGEARRRSAQERAGECRDCVALTAPAGSLVALDADDGSVVALVSHPTFDPSWFVGGLEPERADLLFQDDARPLLNRAIAGRYPAGSTFKPITAYAALSRGIRSADDVWIDGGRHTIDGCRGGGDGACVVQNAGGVALGAVDLRAALARSSDTYFYSLGEAFWNERSAHGEAPIQDAATTFGLGAPTGIELPGESAGTVPTPEQRAATGERWHTGDNVNLAIGQGDLLLTPLQLASVYAAIATGGDRYRPRLVDRVTDGVHGATIEAFAPEQISTAPLDPAVLAPIAEGLRQAPRSGTAAQAFAGFPLDELAIGAKTGTAQVAGRGDYALFAGYGPEAGPGPTIAFAVILEEAGYGGRAAAPAARQFLETLFGIATSDQAAPGHPGAGQAAETAP